MRDPWQPLILIVSNIAIFSLLCWAFGAPS